MKILVVGDIFGKPGRRVFQEVVAEMRAAGEMDLVVANGENAGGGRGPGSKQVADMLEAGADVLTLGDHTWDQVELQPTLESERRLIRPANFSAGVPGRGMVTISTPAGDVTVINLIARVFMSQPHDCPFRAVDALLRDETPRAKTVLVDFHGEATSEKRAMGFHLDGRVTAIWGTHTHVQTSDDQLLPKGTAYITDLGMTGPIHSVIGSDPAAPADPLPHRHSGPVSGGRWSRRSGGHPVGCRREDRQSTKYRAGAAARQQWS